MEPRANYIAQVLGENQGALYAIREIPHFRNCSEELLNLVYTYGRVFSLMEGETLTREGEFDQWVYFIINGKLAVHVGGDWIDTISSALVGERCILGEPRKATLSAGEGGVMALGVDMAVLDALQENENSGKNQIRIYSELLSIITGEIITRIAELSSNQLDISSKLSMYHKLDLEAEIVTGMMENAYLDDREVNMVIHKHLMKNDREELTLSLKEDRFRVDTRKLCSNFLNRGLNGKIPELADEIFTFLNASGKFPPPDLEMGDGAGYDFHHFVGSIAGKMEEKFRSRPESSRAGKSMTLSGWRENFRLSDQFSVDLDKTIGWLESVYRFSAVEIIDFLKFLLQEGSEYTAAINRSTQKMISYLTQLKSMKKLETSRKAVDQVQLDYYSSTSTEDMIPIFSKHILEVHLVNPYLEEITMSEGFHDDSGQPSSSQGAGEDLLKDLFD